MLILTPAPAARGEDRDDRHARASRRCRSRAQRSLEDVAEPRRLPRHSALLDRLRDRRGARHDRRHGHGLGRLADDRARCRARLLLRLFADDASAVEERHRPGRSIPVALAADTISIAVMEVVDNTIMLLIPGAMEAGLANLLFWGSLATALLIAGAVAYPVNRYLIARGRGHAVVHAHH